MLASLGPRAMGGTPIAECLSSPNVANQKANSADLDNPDTQWETNLPLGLFRTL